MTLRTRRSVHAGSWRKLGQSWNRIYRRPAQRASLEPALSPDFRLWLLAVSLAKAGGHAPFDNGELATMLPKFNRTTGEVGQYGSRALNKIIERLIDADMLAPSSSSRCLVVPMHKVDVHETERTLCPEHRHNLAWNGISWCEIDQRTGYVIPPPKRSANGNESLRHAA